MIKLKVYLSRLLVCLLLIVIAVPFPAVEAAAESPSQLTNEFTPTTTLADGTEISALVIDGPPTPPVEYVEERAASMVTSLDRDSSLANFPSYSWVFGCSAVSAAMIAAYYDNNGYPNMYTGPTNGGVMPITDTSWSSWQDVAGVWYPNNPLIASHNGVDGQVGRGSIDDYWVSYFSDADDPYITNSWSEHTPGTAVGDYMKTSQSAYSNIDGSTRFWNRSDGAPLLCSSMPADDGTLGRKQFYEARGYTVTECYNQNTDNNGGGFSLTDFQAEIDAGHPVMLNIEGHTIVGFGYSGSTIYIRDTWNSNPENVYSMTWGGSYAGRGLLGVSIVHIQQPSTPPSTFGKTGPADGGMGQLSNLILSWDAASSTFQYEYCIDEIDNNECDDVWLLNDVFTSVRLNDLDPDTPYFWQVKAVNSEGTTYANGDYWSFTTKDIVYSYLPLILK